MTKIVTIGFLILVLPTYGCDNTRVDGAGGSPPCESASTSSASSSGGPSSESLYPNGISPVIGAEITRIGRAADPMQGDMYHAIVDPLFKAAENTATSADVDARRAAFAIDDLTRNYVAAWVDAADIAPSAWRDGLPMGRLLTPEEASFANARAIVLIRGQRVAAGAQLWDGELDLIAQGVHGAVMDEVPGLPQSWYGSDTAFRLGFEATGYLGAKAGVTSAVEALGLAQQQVGPKVGSVAFAAVQAMIQITTQ